MAVHGVSLNSAGFNFAYLLLVAGISRGAIWWHRPAHPTNFDLELRVKGRISGVYRCTGSAVNFQYWTSSLYLHVENSFSAYIVLRAINKVGITRLTVSPTRTRLDLRAHDSPVLIHVRVILSSIVYTALLSIHSLAALTSYLTNISPR